MRIAILAAGACALLLAGQAPAHAQSKQQIVQECKAMHGGRAGLNNADRTGVTVSQAVQKCVKQRMGGKKKG